MVPRYNQLTDFVEYIVRIDQQDILQKSYATTGVKEVVELDLSVDAELIGSHTETLPEGVGCLYLLVSL